MLPIVWQFEGSLGEQIVTLTQGSLGYSVLVLVPQPEPFTEILMTLLPATCADETVPPEAEPFPLKPESPLVLGVYVRLWLQDEMITTFIKAMNDKARFLMYFPQKIPAFIIARSDAPENLNYLCV
jgi:hypothetical protein